MLGKRFYTGVTPLVLVMMIALMAGCSSNRRVVRGDMATETTSPASSGSRTDTHTPSRPSSFAISAEADNEYALKLMREAYRWIGAPYLYGGATLDGTDCSGFVMMAYKNALDISLPRTSRDMGDYCETINMKGDGIDCSKLKVGDLIFFHTGSDPRRITHVGMYAGEGRMIHAGCSKGVTVVDLSGKYYRDHYLRCGRVAAYHRLIKKK